MKCFVETYTLNLEGLVPSGPPTIDMLLILTSDVNLQHSTWTKFELHNPKVLKTTNSTKFLSSEQSKSKPRIFVQT